MKCSVGISYSEPAPHVEEYIIHSNCWFPPDCSLPHSPVVLSKFAAVTNLQINRVVVLIRYNWGRSHEIRDACFLLLWVGNRFLAAGGRACACVCVRGHHKVTHVRTLVACCRATHVSSVPNIYQVGAFSKSTHLENALRGGALDLGSYYIFSR